MVRRGPPTQLGSAVISPAVSSYRSLIFPFVLLRLSRCRVCGGVTDGQRVARVLQVREQFVASRKLCTAGVAL